MPRRAPERIRSTADLRAFQRLMLEAVIRPLGPGNRARRTWTDGRPAAAVIDTFAAANDRLTGLERIEIYNRMYWFRTLDSLYEDLPGLRAVLGELAQSRKDSVVYFPSYETVMSSGHDAWEADGRHVRLDQLATVAIDSASA